ncbi:UDP-N-acetylmuramoyl-tripeptide--D-alanyl-D-alanine ligase [Patescibacteria group bacterium]
MKKVLRKFVLWLLTKMAKFRLRRFKGKIISVTGSIGKTSTKEAIYAILNTQFKVKKSKKSMNSEFGLPLTILDIESGYSSATKWSWFLIKAAIHCFMKEYSEILLLEMGVDKPGDMDFLISILKPDIAIITNISPVHMGEKQFPSLQAIFDEKAKLVAAVKDSGLAVLNLDNPFTAGLAKKLMKKNLVSYGETRDAEFRATIVKTSLEGTSFTLHHENKRHEVSLNAVGHFQHYVVLPAISCAVKLGMSVEEAILALERFKLPPGRMNLIPAKKDGAQILDSTYNSSPESLKEALHLLKELGGEKKRKIAVIGDMNELGEQSQVLHEIMGELVPKCADLLITVGNRAKIIADKAEELGFNKDHVFSFKTVKSAIDFYEEKIKKDDLILVKGSQNNVRLERFVKAIMAHPENAKDLLVRQDRYWLDKL